MQISKPQADFITSTTRGTIFLGAVGSGKSHALVIKSIKLAIEHKNVVIVSFSLNSLRDVLLPLFFKLFAGMGLIEGRDYRVVRSPAIDITVFGTKILLRTATYPDRLRGLNLHTVLIEEGRELNRYTFDILLGRLRDSSDASWLISTTTRGKDYIYDIIASEKLLDIYNKDARLVSNDSLTVVKTTIDESPFLPEEYVQDLKKQYSSSFLRQELYCEIIDTQGEIINSDWFRIESFEPFKTGVRFWDLAVTTKTTSDYSAGCFMTNIDGKYYINNIVKVKLAYPDLKKLIIETAIQDGLDVVIGLEEAGQQRAIIDDLRRDPQLANHVIKRVKPTRDKINRALPWVSQCELQNVILNQGVWIRDLMDECSRFSVESVQNGTSKDDILDSLSGAYELCTKKAVVQLMHLPI